MEPPAEVVEKGMEVLGGMCFRLEDDVDVAAAVRFASERWSWSRMPVS